MKYRRASLAVTAMLTALTLTVVACSSSASTSSGANGSTVSGSSSGADASQHATLTVAIPSSLVDFSDALIAQAAGLFAKHNLTVKILTNAGSNTLTDVVSGQADLAQYTASAALSAAEQGKSTTVIYGTERDPGAALDTSSGITSLAQLQSEKHCSIASNAQGSQGYAYATIYINKLGLKNCSLMTAGLPALQLGGLKAGTYQAIVTTYQTGVQGVQDGGHMLIDPTNAADLAKYGEPDYLSGSLFGITSTLASERPAIVRYLQAIGDAVKLFESSSDAEVATLLKQADPDFAATPEATLEAQIKSIRPYKGAGLTGKIGDGMTGTLNNQPGFIGSNAWQIVLREYGQYGLSGFVQNAAVNSYAQRVDMSYYDEAFK
jgi:hypothetical protein